MILRHSCEKASEALNDADFKIHKFSSFGFNFDKILCEKFTFSLNKHTIQMLVLWTKGCESNMKQELKRLQKD